MEQRPAPNVSKLWKGLFTPFLFFGGGGRLKKFGNGFFTFV